MSDSQQSAIRSEKQLPTLVTGAGSGLGRAVAEALARSGRPVALVGRREERLIETRALCTAAGSRDVIVLPADITQPGAAERIVSSTIGAFGGLSAIVNNAGIARFGRLEESDPSDWTRMIETNLLAPAALIRHAAPALRASHGVVVNIGSIGGVLALPGRAFYGASKAALSHLTRSLARELAPEVRVNAILPGAIDTEMYASLDLDETAVAKLRAEMIQTTPLQRMGTVDDVIPWVEILLGRGGQWVTGSLLVVDGGRSC